MGQTSLDRLDIFLNESNFLNLARLFTDVPWAKIQCYRPVQKKQKKKKETEDSSDFYSAGLFLSLGLNAHPDSFLER